MKRRSFIKLGAAGTALAGSMSLKATSADPTTTQTSTSFDLTIAPANAEMIDGTIVYTLQYFLGFDDPSPELRVREGEEITVRVTNNDSDGHAFCVHGIPESYIPFVPPGRTRMISFTAETAGTYLYYDPKKEPLNRILGLHGAFIVEPRNDGMTENGSPTPYSESEHNDQLEALFDAFGGNHPRFPGSKWKCRDLRHEKLWLLSQIDPSLNERVAAGEEIDRSTIIANFKPRYFTINGLSGFDTAAHGEEDRHVGKAGRIMPSARQGEPCLLRCINAGLSHHAMHIHGNHCMDLAESDPETGEIHLSDNLYEVDTWNLKPMQTIDTLLPYEKPPDAPAAAWPPSEETFPMRYVMHCHFELSQTAGGGNYPQGAVTHWEMTGPV